MNTPVLPIITDPSLHPNAAYLFGGAKCERCDGSGLDPFPSGRAAEPRAASDFKCARCGGLGLDPKSIVRLELGLPPSPAELLPCHDHGEYGYLHDPRCMGDCGPCGGAGGVPDTGPGGAMALTCLSCGGSGRCPGCNLYLREQARERGLLV